MVRRRKVILTGLLAVICAAQIGAAYAASTKHTARVSIDNLQNQGNGHSGYSVVSNDGRFVAFASDASNLVPNDTNNSSDIFVHDLFTSTTERVSVDSTGGEGNGRSVAPALSADGRFVAFWSNASNLGPGDPTSNWDVFVHDRNTGVTEGVTAGSSGPLARPLVALSTDGRLVAFSSDYSGLVVNDTNGVRDVFVYDRNTAVVERVSVGSGGEEANSRLGSSGSWGVAMSGDGTFVYTPNQDFFGSDTFSYQANDGSLNSNDATVTIMVDPVNDVPQAIPDTYSVAVDGTLSIAAPGLLTNDVDVEGDSLTASLVGNVSNGTLNLNADGSFTYTPVAGFVGTDRFTYMAKDSPTGLFNAVGVLINVSPDSDGNGVIDLNDICPTAPNPSQLDSDGDGAGDQCVLTPEGLAVSVQPPDYLGGTAPVTLTFTDVTQEGTTSLAITTGGRAPSLGFRLRAPGNPTLYYELKTTATFSGSVGVCVSYAGVITAARREDRLELQHRESGRWVDRTTSRDTVNDIICAQTTFL